MRPDAQSKLTDKLVHELREYTIVCLYLYVCFGAVLLYKSALLRAEGISYAHYGLAAFKALILGKFMLVGHALRLGSQFEARPLIYPILHKTLTFLVLLFVLNLVEEATVGVLHGRSVVESISSIAGGDWVQMLAYCLLFFLILLPYFMFREVARFLGEGSLRRVLLTSTRDEHGGGRS